MYRKILSFSLFVFLLTGCTFQKQMPVSGEMSEKTNQITTMATQDISPKQETILYPENWDKNYSVQVYDYLKDVEAENKGSGLSLGSCTKDVPRRSTPTNEPISIEEFFFPSYLQIKEYGCDCLNLFIGFFDPIEKYCQVNQKGDTYILSFLAKNFAHEGLSSFGYHMLVFSPNHLYSVTPKELVQNYDSSPSPDIYWGKSIAKLVENYNKKHPNYDFPDETYMGLQNLVETEMEKEIKSDISTELDSLWEMFQQKIKIFVEML